jgi:hypothetical protein
MANGNAVFVEITAKGQDCMDGDDGNVADYLRRTSERPASSVINIASNSGNMAINSSHFTQSVTNGIDPAEIREVIALTRGELPKFADFEEEAQSLLDQLAHEAEAALPNPDRQNGLLRALLVVAEKAGVPLLIAYLKSKPWWPGAK